MNNVPKFTVIQGGGGDHPVEAPETGNSVEELTCFTREDVLDVLMHVAMRTRLSPVHDLVISTCRKINRHGKYSPDDIVALGTELFLDESDIRETLRRISGRAHKDVEQAMVG